jgi:hypothetical protein
MGRIVTQVVAQGISHARQPAVVDHLEIMQIDVGYMTAVIWRVLLSLLSVYSPIERLAKITQHLWEDAAPTPISGR